MSNRLEIDVLPSPEGELLEVHIHHAISISKANGLDNFKAYLNALYRAFEEQYTTTMHQVVMNPGLIIPSVFQKKEDD